MNRHLVVRDIQSDQHALRIYPCAAAEASRPMKSSVFVFSGTVKPMPASNGSVWIAEFVAVEMSPASMRNMSSASSPHGARSNGLPASAIASNTAHRILRMTEHLVAEFAGIAVMRDTITVRAVEIADAPDGEAEPLQFRDRRLCRRRPYDAFWRISRLFGPWTG